jgi:hypothetical protein
MGRNEVKPEQTSKVLMWMPEKRSVAGMDQAIAPILDSTKTDLASARDGGRFKEDFSARSQDAAELAQNLCLQRRPDRFAKSY